MAISIDFENEFAVNWDANMHSTHKPMPANCQIWGLQIFDWDKSFTKRLKTFTSEDLSIPFQYLEGIPNWEKGADWKEVGEIMGRFESPVVYATSSAQDISFSIIYHAEALKNGDKIRTHWTLENIEVYTRRLQSLVFPQYDGRYGPPTKVLFNIGNIFRNIPLVIKNIQIENQAPYDTLTGLSKMRKITVAARVSYPLYQSIGQMQVYSAYENTNKKSGTEIFAVEQLDTKWRPGSPNSNPYTSAFANFT